MLYSCWVPLFDLGMFALWFNWDRALRIPQGRSRWPNPVGFRREEGYIGITTDKPDSFVVSQ